MTDNKPRPGIDRDQRLSAEGLGRLEKHLQRGAKISRAVRLQWIRRYGAPARDILRQYGYGADPEDE